MNARFVCIALVSCLAVSASAQFATGMPAPEIGLEELLQAPKGSEVSLESLRGKVVVLDFWATWCMPCIRTMPHLNQMVEELKDEPVQFIAVTNESSAKIKSFLKRQEISAWIGIDSDRSMFRDYVVRGIPKTVVIDKEGKLAGVMHPAHLSSEMIRDLVAGKPMQRRRAIPSRAAKQQAAGAAMNPARRPNALPLLSVAIRESQNPQPGNVAMGPGQIFMISVPLREIYAKAYGVDTEQVVGEGIALDKQYDVIIRARVGTEIELLRSSLKAAIPATAKMEIRSRQIYRLELSEAGLGERFKQTQVSGQLPMMSLVGDKAEFVNYSIEELAAWLSTKTDKPVIDATNLPSRYDGEILTLSDVALLRADLEKNLGLKLVVGEQPAELLVVSAIAAK